MNITCITNGGGVFSKLMLAFQNIETVINLVENINHITINTTDKRICNDINVFEYIYDFKKVISKIEIPCDILPVYTENIPEDTLRRFKIITSKIPIRENILHKVNQIKNEKNINERTLGVHIRLTDMNISHGNQYGIRYFKDFTEKINQVINSGDYDKIYIASDNKESIIKCNEMYNNIVYYDDFLRAEKEDDFFYETLIKNFSEEKLWVDAFTEMLLLSKCGALIHRVSNLANAVKIYSKTIYTYFFI